jgi:hypothetical protein
MNTKIITAIVFKLFAIYILVSIIAGLSSIYGVFLNISNSTSGPASLTWPIFMAIVTVIIGFILFKVLWKIGTNVIEQLPQDNDNNTLTNINELEPILLRCLGLYFSVIALMELPTMFIVFWARTHGEDGITGSDYAWLISIIFQLIIGLLLISKTEAWINVFRKLRTVGT